MHLLFCKSSRWPAVLLVFTVVSCLNAQQPSGTRERWTEAQANAWYTQQPWPVGADFLPSTAVNELEMWQADTFDPATIDRELGWADAIGMNTMRVFLHNLLWDQDPKGFTSRIDTFLGIAARHHIRPVFVLFDSCWDPRPKLGPQHPPIPGVHNSGWVQAPGTEVLSDPAQFPRLEIYVKGVVGAFANDPRILAWDIWNEPDNGNADSYAQLALRSRSPVASGTVNGHPPQHYPRWPASRSNSLTSSAFTTTAGRRILRGEWRNSSSFIDLSYARNIWPAILAVHLTPFFPSQSYTMLAPSTGALSPARARPGYPGTPGSAPTSLTSPWCGNMTFFAPTVPHIGSAKWK
jgi:hypothetical protein